MEKGRIIKAGEWKRLVSSLLRCGCFNSAVFRDKGRRAKEGRGKRKEEGEVWPGIFLPLCARKTADGELGRRYIVYGRHKTTLSHSL